MPGSDSTGDGVRNNLSILTDIVDLPTFSQILEMDDDEACEFSISIVLGYFEQAHETFQKMHESLDSKNLEELSNYGHFLKGSSATLGLIKIRDSCEKIQRYGKHENLEGQPENDSEKCLRLITETLEVLEKDHSDVERRLKLYYGLET